MDEEGSPPTEEAEFDSESEQTDTQTKGKSRETDSTTESDLHGEGEDDIELHDHDEDESQDFPKEWEKHHITEFSLAQRDYFCFGLFDYIPQASRWASGMLTWMWHLIVAICCCGRCGLRYCWKSENGEHKSDCVLPFIAPAFLSAIHWALRMAIACLLSSIFCFYAPVADWFGCTYLSLVD